MPAEPREHDPSHHFEVAGRLAISSGSRTTYGHSTKIAPRLPRDRRASRDAALTFTGTPDALIGSSRFQALPEKGRPIGGPHFGSQAR